MQVVPHRVVDRGEGLAVTLTSEELEEIGRVFADVWVEANDVGPLRAIYDEDAVFVSPLFSRRVEGREAIMSCFERLFSGLAEGERFEILAVLPGVEMLNVFWKLGDALGADTLLIGEGGMITMHYDTGPHVTSW